MPATQILVIGDQGTGKSTSWENMNPAETIIISPNAKPLPWPGSAKQYIVGKNRIQTKNITDIPGLLTVINDSKPEIKNVLVEDLNHFYNARTTSPEFFARKNGNDAYAKWGELGNDVARIIAVGEKFRDDLNIVYHAHTELHEDGQIGMLSPGKLLDREIKPASYFTHVLHTLVNKTDKGIEYVFLTNKNGTHDAKTPKGCFKQLLIPNDIKTVIEAVRSYHNG